MADRQIIDVHCHLFNAQHAIMELAAATWDKLWGNYPHQKGVARKRVVRGIEAPLEGVRDFAAWIARLLEVAVSDCEGNYGIAQENFKQSSLGKAGPLLVAPLMMDIYFSLDDNKDQAKVRARVRRAAPIAETFAVPEDQKERFAAHFLEIENLIREEVAKTRPAKRRALPDRGLDAVFQEARDELLAAPKKVRRGVDYQGIELSPGYKKHLHDLEALRAKYPKQVFPFLAVDPRRIGIMKLIDMKVKKGKGAFKGIKLYPPLGYLPTHPNLAAVFAYCSQYDVPITLHCSEGGMKNFRSKNYVTSWEGRNHWEDFETSCGNKSRYYTAPEKWAPVLKKWPDLRISFAHFGGGDKLASGDTAWLNAIIKLIQRHPNVYADLSYFSKKGLADKISQVIAKNPAVKTKVMFGTDYSMVMMDKALGGLKNYFDRFAGIDQAVLSDNARRFLKI